jgi:hypothetical protein
MAGCSVQYLPKIVSKFLSEFIQLVIANVFQFIRHSFFQEGRNVFCTSETQLNVFAFLRLYCILTYGSLDLNLMYVMFFYVTCCV